jgi:hypothetical protein
VAPVLTESDFEDSPYIPEATLNPPVPAATENKTVNTVPGSPALPAPEPVKPPIDPEFTTDIVIGTMDTIQYTVFLMLNNRKQKNMRFKDVNEYRQAISLSYLSPTELENLENKEESKILVEKLKDYQGKMENINKKIPFLPDERMKLKKPVLELVKQNNFDIPPGLAFVLAMGEVLSNRIIDLAFE